MRAGILAVFLLLAACSGASPIPSGDPVRVLATGLPTISEPFLVHVAVTQDDYMQRWRQLGSSDAPPPVDFATEVAIYLGMAGSSSCPANFTHLVVDEDSAHVYAEWDDGTLANGNRACTDDLAPQGVALAVSRAVLPAGQFTLTLRPDLMCPDCPDHPDQTVVTVR